MKINRRLTTLFASSNIHSVSPTFFFSWKFSDYFASRAWLREISFEYMHAQKSSLFLSDRLYYMTLPHNATCITQPSLTLCENKATVRDYFAHAPAETRGAKRNRLPKLRAPERTSDKAQFYVYAPDSSECFSFPKRIDSHIRKYGYNYAALCAGDISVRLRCCFDYEKLGCSECMSFLSRNDYLKWENNKVDQSFVNDARDHFARKETF